MSRRPAEKTSPRLGQLLARAKVPGVPPSVNHSYRVGRNGRLYKTSEAKGWQMMASVILSGGRNPGKERRWPHEGEVHLDMIFHSRSRRRSDLDNRIKAVQDCLIMAGILADDSQVKALSAQRICDGVDAVEIEVWDLEGAK